jgi:hypothetical protein
MATGEDFETGGPRGNALLSFARDNLTLVASVGSALIFAIRCVVVSGGDAYTASILVMQTPIQDVIRALIFPLVPLALLVVSGMAAVAAANKDQWLEPATWGLIAVSVASLLLFGYVVEGYMGSSIADRLLYYATSLVPLMIAVFVRHRNTIFGSNLTRDRAGRIFEGLVRWSIGAIILLIIGVSVAQSVFGRDTFWLPRERLVFDGERPFTGYVIRVNEDHLVVMNDDPRIIIEKKRNDLHDRAICYPEWYEDEFKEAERAVPTCP